MAMGRPRASTMAWIFVLRPPRERPIACASAPLFRLPPTGEPWPSCCRWLDHRRARRAPARQTSGAKSHASSSGESDCRPSSKAPRRPAILPATAGLQNVDDAADDPPVDGPSRPRLVLGQQRPNGSPLRFAQPKFARHDPSPPTRYGLNHRPIYTLIELGA
jgi:hypothetical protein